MEFGFSFRYEVALVHANIRPKLCESLAGRGVAIACSRCRSQSVGCAMLGSWTWRRVLQDALRQPSRQDARNPHEQEPHASASSAVCVLGFTTSQGWRAD